MDYDVAIIGAGMSGLAAGIRIAHFDKRVCIFERHYAYGGLNSYYKIGRREFDVGLHAVTNYCTGGRRNSPLPKLLRQLRLDFEDFDLHPQGFSEIQFPGRTLRFSNDIQVLIDQVAELFPGEVDNFRRVISDIEDYEDAQTDTPWVSTRKVLADYLRDPLLIEMILCPIMFYGSAEEHDMDFRSFVTLFKSILLEGFARPVGGVRTIIKALVRRYRENGGKIRMSCGVERIDCSKADAVELTLATGEKVTAGVVLSSIGYPETIAIAAADGASRRTIAERDQQTEIGALSFVETIAVLDRPPAELGFNSTITFANDSEKFHYASPRDPIDLSSRIVCCPNNYEGHESLPEGIFRMTWLANHSLWMGLGESEYAAHKRDYYEKFLTQAEWFVPKVRDHVVFWDMFTPRTIRQYTGHVNGAVYGSPVKHRDGRTPFKNLFICGTDQGYLGIVGAMLSGIMIANDRVLANG